MPPIFSRREFAGRTPSSPFAWVRLWRGSCLPLSGYRGREEIPLLPLLFAPSHFCIILPWWLVSLKAAQDTYLYLKVRGWKRVSAGQVTSIYLRWLQKGSGCKCIILRANSETSPTLPACPRSPTQLLCGWKLCFSCAPVNFIFCCFPLCAA